MTLPTDNLISGPITKFEYYTDPLPGMATFALYDIVADCFLIVLNNIVIARQLRHILSSRYQLHVVQINSADNYTHGMVLNSNCDQWTLQNRKDINFSNPVSDKTVTATNLRPPREAAPYNVLNEKLWCLFCRHWLTFIRRNNELNDCNEKIQAYTGMDIFLNQFLDLQGVKSPFKTISAAEQNKILNLLYLGRDLAQTELEIKNLIESV